MQVLLFILRLIGTETDIPMWMFWIFEIRPQIMPANVDQNIS